MFCLLVHYFSANLTSTGPAKIINNGPPPKKRKRVVPPTQSESELVNNRPVRTNKSTYRRSEQQELNDRTDGNSLQNDNVMNNSSNILNNLDLNQSPESTSLQSENNPIDYAKLAEEILKHTRQPAIPGIIPVKEQSQISHPYASSFSQPTAFSQLIQNSTSQPIGTTHQPGTFQNNVLPPSQPQSSSHIPSGFSTTWSSNNNRTTTCCSWEHFAFI